jgi:hypothetical protein
MSADTWQRLDRRVKTARARAEEAPDEHGIRASRNLDELRKLQWSIEKLMDDEIIRGRDQGASWSMLGTSKQQAQQRHKRALERVNRH